MPKNLIINENLPKIIIPKEKTKLFMDWYKKDLYMEDAIPRVFDEGYFVVNLSDFIKVVSLNLLGLDSVKFAIQLKLINGIHERYDRAVLHYKFINDTTIQLSSYSEATGELVCHSDGFDLGIIKTERFIANIKNAISSPNTSCADVDEDLVLDIRNLDEATKIHPGSGYIFEKDIQTMWSTFSEKWTNTCMYLLISAFWYLASAKQEDIDMLKVDNYVIKSARYDNSNKNRHNKHKNKVRNITTPIYNFGFVKEVDVNKLTAKKKGWKISYEFQVRGHYRHYKSGKVVFIKSFEKGKGLEKKQTVLNLNPIF